MGHTMLDVKYRMRRPTSFVGIDPVARRRCTIENFGAAAVTVPVRLGIIVIPIVSPTCPVVMVVVPIPRGVCPYLSPPKRVVEHVVPQQRLGHNVLIMFLKILVILSLVVREDGMKVKSVI